jgi:hypothetical protein
MIERASVTTQQPAPRFLRFMTALVLGTAVATVSGGLTGCDGSDDAPPAIDASVDATVDATVDAPPDGVTIDGPLPPPDLARAV